MRKKGQVSMFIIIGILLVLVVAIVYGVYSGIIGELADKMKRGAERVPAEVQPIRDSMSGCVGSVAREGIALIGRQGGFVELKDDGMPTSSYNPMASNLEMFKYSDFRIPFWFREKPNGIQQLSMPSKEAVENELSSYVKNSIGLCTANITILAGEGYSFTFTGEPEVKAKILDNNVKIDVEYAVDIIKGDKTFRIESFGVDVKSSLGELYDTAQEIMKKEADEMFLEKKTLDMLAAYGDEVPHVGVKMECGEKSWSKRRVIDALKSIISGNIGAVRIKKTNYELGDSTFKFMEYDALSKQRDVVVSMTYTPSWPTYINVIPAEGDVMKSQSVTKNSGSQLVSLASGFFCLNYYQFVYTIKYPVLVSVEKGGEMFQFATEVIVDRDQPRKNNYATEEYDMESEICSHPENELKVYAYYINEQGTPEPLNDVEIYFKCGGARCSSGKIIEGISGAEIKVPACFQGIVEGRKDSFAGGKTYGVSTNQKIESAVPVLLKKIYKPSVMVMVIDLEKGEIREPYDSESINFQFVNMNMTFVSSYTWPDDNNEGRIELVEGDYRVSSIITGKSSSKITVQKKEIENCVDAPGAGFLGFLSSEKKCYNIEIPKIELDEGVKGGANFNYRAENGLLRDNAELTLYVMAEPLTSNMDEMAMRYEAFDDNVNDARFKYPELI